MRTILILTASVFLSACCSDLLGRINSQTIKLKVTDYSGVQRVDWPVTSGIPFPKGVIRDEQHIALFDSQGKEIPLQTSVLSRYWEADSSIRWVLLDFNANVPANGTSYYTVKYGNEIHRHEFPTELKVKEEGEEVSINTGVLKFKVGKDFLTDVELKTKEGWKEVSGSKGGDMTMDITAPPDMNLPAVVLGKGRNEGHYSSRLTKDVEIKIEDNGLLRVQVKVRGLYRREDGRVFGPFTLRVNAYSGKSYLKIYHTFVNSDLPERGLIKDVGIELPLQIRNAKEISFGTELLTNVKGVGKGPYYLLQDNWNDYKISESGKDKDYSGQSEGWMDVSNGSVGVTAMFRNCAQLFPKEIKYENNELTMWLYPEDGVGPLDLRREEEKHTPSWEKFKKDYPAAYDLWDKRSSASFQKALESGNLYYIMDHTGLGVARTHTIILNFHSTESSVNQLENFSKETSKPLRAFALNHWYDYTDALGRIGWKDTVDFPFVENYFEKKIDWAIKNQNEWFPNHFWGIINYGGMQSWFFPDSSSMGPAMQWGWYLGRYGWLNAEVDAAKDLVLYYLRSGDERTYNFAESVARNMMDVVTAHSNLPDFEPVNTVPDWKLGGMNRHEYDPYGGGVLENHTWNEGLIDYYYLTGYRRAYDVAMEVGNFALRLYGHANRIKQWQLYEKQFDRDASNNYKIILKSYELTGQKKFKEEAIKWGNYYLKNSPYSYRGLPQALFMTDWYLTPALVLDNQLFHDSRVEEEIMDIAKWDTDSLKASSTDHYLRTAGFLAAAVSFDITCGGGPLEDLIKTWWNKLIKEYERPEPYSTSMADFTTMRWNEFTPLFYFLRACHDINLTEKSAK